MADLDSRYRPHLESLLDPGEELGGLCIASRQRGMFRGGTVVIGVTGRRLILQPLGRRGDPDGEVLSIGSEEVASARAGGAGGDWFNVYAGIMDHAAVALQIKTIGGEKVKLMMMRGEGRVLGKLGGGETQRLGLEALAEWFRAIER